MATRELAFVTPHFRCRGLTESQYAASERRGDEWSARSHQDKRTNFVATVLATLFLSGAVMTTAVYVSRRHSRSASSKRLRASRRLVPGQALAVVGPAAVDPSWISPRRRNWSAWRVRHVQQAQSVRTRPRWMRPSCGRSASPCRVGTRPRGCAATRRGTRDSGRGGMAATGGAARRCDRAASET